jgi:formylglycine-generating enzyme required for sulfatase activity
MAHEDPVPVLGSHAAIHVCRQHAVKARARLNCAQFPRVLHERGTRTQHSQAALERFADLVARHDGGEVFDFARELRQPPELAGELAALHQNWTRLRGLLESVRAGASEIESAELESGGRALRLDARTQALLDLLARFRGSEPRYEVLGEIARGGMGIVLRVREKGVERELALKRMFSAEELPAGLRPLRAQLLRRLLDEAWILSRLDHPGIVQLHELGVDPEGRVYFTMPLVRGRTLAEVFTLAREQREGWSIPRALGLLQRVCEALAFAHSQGIVHRDLKPANVMVGRFGEVQVMDWGLARAEHGPQLSAAGGAQGEGGLDGDSALTLGGDVLGTPAYMAPEQALGRSAEASPRADVYALGALLYELLAGARPYDEFRSAGSARELLAHVKAGPPRPIEEQAPGEPPELLAICRKAMQRESEQRYPSMEALAAELRAYREGRVVRALESGALAELRKWIGRNRRVAAALGFGALSLLAAAGIAVWTDVRAAARVRFEADRRGPAALAARAARLWPARPERIHELEAWLREARELVAHARTTAPSSRACAPASCACPRTIRASWRRSSGAPGSWRASSSTSWASTTSCCSSRGAPTRSACARPRGLAGAQGALRTAARGAARARPARAGARPARERGAGPARLARRAARRARAALRSAALRGTIADVERRLEVARTLPERTLDDCAQLWSEASAAIADPARSPAYAGLRLESQLGLVPLGPDPESGLWEFADIGTGTAPVRGADGRLHLEAANGIVFVLVPGGLATIGSVGAERQPGFALEPDELARQQELGPRELRLEAYFLSKYELTQGQWLRMCGSNPSYNSVGKRFGGPTADLCYPVDHMTWFAATEVLARFGLRLPSEAQWEHAARAGTLSRFWWGQDPQGACGKEHNNSCPDRCDTSLRADRFAPNPWGFHCILGNLCEWTSDNYWTSYRWTFADDGSGRQFSPESGLRVVRGGSFADRVEELRVSRRVDAPPDQPSTAFGLRPLRRIEPRLPLSAATPADAAAPPLPDRR